MHSFFHRMHLHENKINKSISVAAIFTLRLQRHKKRIVAKAIHGMQTNDYIRHSNEITYFYQTNIHWNVDKQLILRKYLYIIHFIQEFLFESI